MDTRGRGGGVWVVTAALLAIAGAVFHNVMEFGWSIVSGPETYVSNDVLAVLLVAWVILRRRWLLVTIGAVGVVFLLGTIATVLPLPVLPFLPDQSADHYLVHGVTAVLQAPLPLVVWRLLQRQGGKFRPSTIPGTG